MTNVIIYSRWLFATFLISKPAIHRFTCRELAERRKIENHIGVVNEMITD